MADEPENTPDPNTPPAETPPKDDGLGEAGKKALDAERRAARAANKERDALAAELKALQDRDKTEAEKVAERATAAETRAAAVEVQSLRTEVILDKIPDTATVAEARRLIATLSKRLVGSTREEMEADADELLSTFKPAEPVPPSLDLGQRLNQPPEPATSRERINAGLAEFMK